MGKCSFYLSLKGYEGEKASQNLACKLEDHAFNLYMRLPAPFQNNAEIIK